MEELGKRNDVRAYNFSRQYPSALFPGKTQYVSPSDPAPEKQAPRLLDSINPLSWRRCAQEILRWKPDVAVICWWMSFFGPSVGTVAGILKSHGVKVIGLLHNAFPHEPKFWDKPLTKYFLDRCDAFVTLSAEVQTSLTRLGAYRSLQLFHPVYNRFAKSFSRTEAEDALEIPRGGKNLLFFGLIRKYKGLDLLLKAFETLPQDCNLIIAGEPYGSFEEYDAIITASPAFRRIFCFLEYIPDEQVGKYFSAADLTVLPYRTASQSGVMAVSYNFGVPLAVTAAGSLKEEVEKAGTGVVSASISPEGIAESIKTFFDSPGLQEECKKNIKKELERLSWSNFGKAFEEYAAKI